MARIRQVQRRDGTLIPFRERKVSDSILEALRTAGHDDRPLADELASVVTLFLEKYQTQAVPTLPDVEDMVHRVLQETGHAQAARGLKELRAARRRLSDELSVRRTSNPLNSHPAPGAPWDVSPWNRPRLVADLTVSWEIPESLSEEIASSIERKLMACEHKCVSSSLINELIENELFARELEGAAGRDPRWGIRRSELQALARGETQSGTPYGSILAKSLTPFALSEIHGPSTALAHEGGRLHVYGLADPLKVDRLRVPVGLLHSKGGSALERLLCSRVQLDCLGAYVSQEIELPDLVGSLACTTEAKESPKDLVRALVAALDFRDAYGALRPPALHLVVPLGSREGDVGVEFIEELLEVIDRCAEPTPLWPTVTLVPPNEPDGDSGAGLLERGMALAARRPGVHVRIPREHDTPAVPAETPRLPTPLQLGLCRVALNLPLALAETHGTTLTEVLSELEGVGRLILGAFHERFWFQRSGAPHGLRAVVLGLGGPGRVQVSAVGQEVDLEVWGLGHALEFLIRRGVVRPQERPEASARLLGYLDYVLGEEHDGVQFRVRLGGTRDREVRRRFLEVLRERALSLGDPHLNAMVREDLAERSTLPVVLPLLSDRNAPLLGTPFAERVAPGLSLPAGALGDLDPTRLLSRLRKETRLGLLSIASRHPADGVFEVQEELF